MDNLPFVNIDSLELAAIDHKFYTDSDNPDLSGLDWAMQEDFKLGTGCSRIPFFGYGVPWSFLR